MSVPVTGDEERVRILVPNVAAVDAVVTRVVPGAAELAFVQQPGVPVRFLHRRRATLVPETRDARVDGTLFAIPGPSGRVRDDRLHFLQSTVRPGPARRPQRRDHARVDLVRPVALMPDRLQLGWLNGFVRNVSAGGVLVAGAEALAAGERLRLRFELEGEDDVVDLLGRVVRADEAWGLRGLRLEGVSDQERERLVRFVFERQRRALAARSALPA